MGLLIGMDEAGYGPNLGPLIVTVTKWEVPGSPREFNLWEAMSEVARQTPTKEPLMLQVADSKQVYSPGKGLAALEKSVLSALRMLGHRTESLADLTTVLRPDVAHATTLTRSVNEDGRSTSFPIPGLFERSPSLTLQVSAMTRKVPAAAPWLDRELTLPTEVDATLIADIATHWQECCRRASVTLLAMHSAIVQPAEFNDLVRSANNKALALSRISLNLLRSVWNPDDEQPTLVICDKHGGRNRYDDLLAEVLDDRMIFAATESKERSVYRVGATELRFQMKAEANFPVALASLVCKYVRELSMHVFNDFWAEQIPGLKPTAGYPLDAVRFRADIATTQQQIGISDEVLWRER